MAHRHELSEAEWARIAPLLPPERTRGTYYRDHRSVLNGMLYRHATGRPWRDVPEQYGPWCTLHSRYRRWTREGLWDHILGALQRDLDAASQIDWRLWCIDGSHARAQAGVRPCGLPTPARDRELRGVAQGGARRGHALREARDPLSRLRQARVA